MTRRIIRTATIAIAIAALAAPTALARPADPSEAVLKAAAAAEQQQNPRSPDAIAATRPAPESRSSTRADTTPTAAVDRGIGWATIGIGIAGGLLAIGAIAAIAGRTRRTGRGRTTA
jgi:hypothetical protein